MSKTDLPTLLEQYKLFVGMADQVSERRLKTNQFYVGVISGLLAVLAFVYKKDNFNNLQSYHEAIVIAVTVLGLSLNCLWFINIRSFRKLNSGKFEVIHQMESLLPFQPFDLEWEIIKKGERQNRYFQLSRLEQFLPLILSIPFLVLILLILT